MSADFAFFFLAAVLLGLSTMLLVMYRRFRGRHAVICPETQQPAQARVKAGLAAVTWMASQPRLVVTSCSQWPEGAGCDRSCTRQIEALAEKRSP